MYTIHMYYINQNGLTLYCNIYKKFTKLEFV